MKFLRYAVNGDEEPCVTIPATRLHIDDDYAQRRARNLAALMLGRLGWNLKEVGALLRLHPDTVRWHVVRDLTRRLKQPPVRWTKRVKPLDPEVKTSQLDQVIQQLLDAGYGVRMVASIFHTSMKKINDRHTKTNP